MISSGKNERWEGFRVRWVRDAQEEPLQCLSSRGASSHYANACGASSQRPVEAGLLHHECDHPERRYRELGHHREEAGEDGG